MNRTAALDVEASMAAAASNMRRVAQYGVYTGRLLTREAVRYFDRCRLFHRETGSLLVFTRDAGYHSSGWWKNPDYEHCLHLSLSFRPLEDDRGALPKDRRLTDRWIDLFFGDTKRLLWAESPFSPEGKQRDVWHYRLFTDPTYAVPLLPRGEVYSKQFTELGWLSWSDLGYEREQAPQTGSGTAEG